MTNREILDFLLSEIKERGITNYAIRRDTMITEGSMHKLAQGGGANLATAVKLADYLGYTVELKKKE